MNFSKRKAEKRKEYLREIARKEGNKFCFICNQRGPLYVVLPFTIFVCSTCAAVHRSFQHKVKGISMCEFTDEEMTRLRIGGNDRAHEIWIGKDNNAVANIRNKTNNFSLLSESVAYTIIYSVFKEKKYFNQAKYEEFEHDVKHSHLVIGQSDGDYTLNRANKNLEMSKSTSISSFPLLPSRKDIKEGKKKESTEQGNDTKETLDISLNNAENVHNKQITDTSITAEPSSKQEHSAHQEKKHCQNTENDDLFVMQSNQPNKTLEDMFAPTNLINSSEVNNNEFFSSLLDAKSTPHIQHEQHQEQIESATNTRHYNNNNTSINNNTANNSTTQSVLDDLFAPSSFSQIGQTQNTVATATTATTATTTAFQNFSDYCLINNNNNVNYVNNNTYNCNTNNNQGNILDNYNYNNAIYNNSNYTSNIDNFFLQRQQQQQQSPKIDERENQQNKYDANAFASLNPFS